MLNRYYIYHHTNPITNEVFYVGKGTGRRAFEEGGRNLEWSAYVAQLLASGAMYSVSIIKCELTETQALLLEAQEISRLAAENQPLTNRAQIKCNKELDVDYVDQTLEIKERLVDIRKSAGLRQSDMAFALGVAVPTYAQHETKERGMTIETACKCFNLLGYKLAVVAKDNM